jgi:hypothetical protein
VQVSLDPGAQGLPSGIYNDAITFSNHQSGVVQTRRVSLQIGQPDYFTELFAQGDNDLSFHTLTFTPDGSSSFYCACRTSATNFPTDPTGGTILSLGDDSFAQVDLGGWQAWLYGVNYGSFYVGANGYITFNRADDSYAESTATHFALPRISGLFRDLNPSAGGTVSWKQLADRVAVTWENVPEYGKANSNSFQIEILFADSSIRLTHLAIAAKLGLAGLSRGTGEPAGFSDSDLSAYGPCVPMLSLAIPKNVNETNGVLLGAGVVGIPQPIESDLVVSLSSSDPAQVAVSPAAVILAGQTSATFDLTVFDNALLDGSRIIRVTAAATGYRETSDFLFLHDNETVTLGVTLPPSVREGDGLLAGAGTLTLSAPPDRSVVVYFASSDTNELATPAPLIIPAGQTSVAFDVTVLDDQQLDGAKTVSLTAHVQNWVDGSTTMAILDNETPPTVSVARSGNNLILSWPVSFTGFGVETATNLTPTISWSAVTNQTQTVGSQFRITVDSTPGQQFFRLTRF